MREQARDLARIESDRRPHRVVYLCHDLLGWRHDFTSLGTFLDAILLRALASAEHELQEVASGSYVDDAP